MHAGKFCVWQVASKSHTDVGVRRRASVSDSPIMLYSLSWSQPWCCWLPTPCLVPTCFSQPPSWQLRNSANSLLVKGRKKKKKQALSMLLLISSGIWQWEWGGRKEPQRRRDKVKKKAGLKYGSEHTVEC